MAKAAKEIPQVAVDLSERVGQKFLRDIMERFENVETARGKYMNAARKEKEAMQTIYEGMAARGISQKSAKTNIKIYQLLEKAKGLQAELDADERKQYQKLVKAQGDKKQMLLFGELPAMPKPVKEKSKKDAPVQTDIEDTVHEGAALN